MAKKPSDPGQQLSPVRVAPLGELNAYTVHEHELDIIAAGSPATLAFNIAVALISFGVSFVLTLTTTTITSDRLFYSYLIICINCLTVGFLLLGYWWRTRKSVLVIVSKIKSRMPSPPAIQEQMPEEDNPRSIVTGAASPSTQVTSGQPTEASQASGSLGVAPRAASEPDAKGRPEEASGQGSPAR